MQAQPCECILNLKLSRLRSAFTSICDLLDQQGWNILSEHLKSLNVLDARDMSAIHHASSLAVASPTKELLLRLEQKSNIDFSVHALLFYMNSLQMPQYFQIYMMIAPLHKKNCRISFENERKKILDELFSEDHASTMMQQSPNAGYPMVHESPLTNFTFNNLQTFPVLSSGVSHAIPNTMFPPTLNLTNEKGIQMPFSSQAYKQPGLQMNSINNLSHPNKPYLCIVEHPKEQRLNCGEGLILRCVAESDQANVHYSWQRDGIKLPDQTNKVLMILDAQPSDDGIYVCTVTCDNSLSAVSNAAKVEIVKELGCSINKDVHSDYDNVSMTATAKFALLIANEDYVHNTTLASATNDVAALASTLRKKLQFKTVSLVNLNLSEMERAVKVFCSYLINGSYCVLYLAGHGFENDGQCYIVPTDAPKDYTYENCFSVKKMIQDISLHDLHLTVVLLDVCRRRNERAVKLPEPTHNKFKSCNFVISFATMESGMAYEVKGRKLGAYVSNLQNHLSKDKRITRVLELVHQDMHKCELTRGVQQPEFKSNMFEDRKLTDPLKSPFNAEKQNIHDYEWNEVHVGQKPILFFFESCGVYVKLNVTCLFSNILLIEAIVIDKGGTSICNVSINLTSDSQSQNGSSTSCIRLEDLQRLNTHMKILPISINISYVINEFIFEESWDDNIDIPFITWWMPDE
ncbi:mucosa-associated lymphoid tissue lymphoma translocation protein 1-like [Styela clava]